MSEGAKDFVAGTAAGMVQVLVGHPLDTIKVRLQTQGHPQKFSGPMDCAVQTVRKEGFFALYKGMSSPLVGIAAVNALLFGFYGRAKTALGETPTNNLSLEKIMMSGAVAGVGNSILASPVELIKCRLQIQTEALNPKYTGPIDCVKYIVKVEGPAGIMKGFIATCLRELPAYAFFYGGFEFAKRSWAKLNGQDPMKPFDLPLWQTMLSGSVGGVGYWISSYPFDSIKSRIQTIPEGTKMSIPECARSLFAEGGINAFYKGLSPTLMRAVPAAAVTLTTYEVVMKALNTMFPPTGPVHHRAPDELAAAEAGKN
eukprot:Clim_evm1s210 gene=Clim_evmTU1s210